MFKCLLVGQFTHAGVAKSASSKQECSSAPITIVVKKNTFSIVVAMIAILGSNVLLLLGVAHGILSPREWAFGVLAWFAAIFLWAVVRKRAARKTLSSNAGPPVALGSHARRRIRRTIRMSKAWIGVLAVCLPIGVVDGVAHRAWLPTLTGVGISVLMMYVALQKIRRLRTLVADLPRE